MNRKVLLPLAILIAAVMMATPLVSTAQAKITGINEKDGYTEYLGTLGGANFFVLIPDTWDARGRMLVVLCRPATFAADPTKYVFEYPFAGRLAKQGYAVALSNWGSGAGTKEGVIHTHQLTEYVIDNYGITGKVFLFGTSAGGTVALLLAEAHPEVYSGVLDLSGVKDLEYQYNTYANYQGSDPFLAMFFAGGKAAFEAGCGGTPEERPNKYQKYSPIYHANIAIPVISVIHAQDQIVEPEQTEMYHAALSDPSLHYVFYVTKVTPGALPIPPPLPPATGWYGHFDPWTYVYAEIYFSNLVKWSFGSWSPP